MCTGTPFFARLTRRVTGVYLTATSADSEPPRELRRALPAALGACDPYPDMAGLSMESEAPLLRRVLLVDGTGGSLPGDLVARLDLRRLAVPR